LREGKLSTLSAPIAWGMDKYLTDTVSIGPKSVIEKAIGGDGNDVLTGNDAKNTLQGGLGNDRLGGGRGDDRLYGEWGSDVLTGGSGKDAFVFNTDPSNGDIDRITDFSVKDDTIWLSQSVFAALPRKGALASSFFKVGSAATISSSTTRRPVCCRMMLTGPGQGPRWQSLTSSRAWRSPTRTSLWSDTEKAGL
jgi:hypothetical protein